MAEHRVKVLIIDEDKAFLEEAVTELSDHFTVYTSETGVNGLKIFAQLRPPVVIVDAGISDISFSNLLDDLKGLDALVLRIATSHNYRVIEEVVQAIDAGLIYKYFRKPVNYFDLIEIINARTVNYQVGGGIHHSAAVSPAYVKLHNIVDKAREVERLRKQLESQLAKIKDIEVESLNKVKDALEETRMLREKVADNETVISALQVKSLELEELKKRDIDQVELERKTLKLELKGLRDDYEHLFREKEDLGHIKSDNEKLKKELDALRADNGDLRVLVAQERATMVEDLTREREEVERKKDEAERVVEVQRERNRAELQAMQDAFEEEKQQTTREIEILKTELEENRKASLAGIETKRKQMEDELARKKEEAEQAIEVQKERNKARLQALRDAFEEEKKHAVSHEIEGLKAELEKDRQAKLAQIEEDRIRAEKEIAGLRAAMAEEKEQLEKKVKEQREKAETEVQHIRESVVKEQEKLTMELEATLTEMRKTAEAEAKELKAGTTRELDRFKAVAEKKERELSEALTQARRIAREMEERLKLTEGRIGALESEIENKIHEKDLILRELESVRADFAVAVQSREALLSEIAEMRTGLK